MRIIPLIVLLCLLIGGCTHRYQHYDYEAGISSVRGGLIRVWFEGEYTLLRKSPKVTRVGSPYCLWLGWRGSDPTLVGKEIKIHIELIQQEASSLSIAPGHIATGRVFAVDSELFPNDGWNSIYNARHCALEVEVHAPIEVEGRIIIGGESETFKVNLKPNYWQELRNDGLDAISSV